MSPKRLCNLGESAKVADKAMLLLDVLAVAD